MKIVVISQKTAFVRHWFKWYKVQRSGEDWRPLPIGKKYEKEFDIEKVSKSLQKKYGKSKLPKEIEELEQKKRAV